jgi:putative ABC transport system permease protein
MLAGLLALRQTLQGTLLGNFVLLQTAVPQLAGALVAILLTFASISDLLLLQVRERQREIGLLRAVGWRPALIRRLFLHEGLALSIVGAIPGAAVASAILLAQHQAQGTVPLPVVAASVALVMLIVATVATIPAVRAANRVQVVNVLQAE